MFSLCWVLTRYTSRFSEPEQTYHMHPCINHRLTARYPPDEPGRKKYIEELFAATGEREMMTKEEDMYSLLLQGYDVDSLESGYFGHCMLGDSKARKSINHQDLTIVMARGRKLDTRSTENWEERQAVQGGVYVNGCMKCRRQDHEWNTGCGVKLSIEHMSQVSKTIPLSMER